MFDAAVADDHCRLSRHGARWLSTGPTGGTVRADVAATFTVPADFDRRDVAAYTAGRRERVALPADGPTLLTGVDAAHARGARTGPVTVVATAGLTNPATLPMEPTGAADSEVADDSRPPTGTVNLLVGTTRALGEGTLAELLATAVEAKTATLLATAGFTGTTSDALAVGCDPAGEPVEFAGSGTAVGAAARACVRDAVRASLAAWCDHRGLPDTVDDADHGAVTTRDTELLDF